jgi:methylmalonyl-CoA mutase
MEQAMDALNSVDVKEKDAAINTLKSAYAEWELRLDGQNKKLLQAFPTKVAAYKSDFYIFKVRDKEIKIQTWYESLSHSRIPKISVPTFRSLGRSVEVDVEREFSGRISIYCRCISIQA